jgi:hypothetical protein
MVRDIEERTEPGRPEMDVDLIGPHMGKLGPAASISS